MLSEKRMACFCSQREMSKDTLEHKNNNQTHNFTDSKDYKILKLSAEEYILNTNENKYNTYNQTLGNINKVQQS